MEINRRFLTVLTPDGEFLHVRRQDQLYQVGQDCSQCFCFSFYNYYKCISQSSVRYMSIDVNPSIELGMNENLKVVELIPYNKDGEKIVNMLSNWKRKGIEEVTLGNQLLL